MMEPPKSDKKGVSMTSTAIITNAADLLEEAAREIEIRGWGRNMAMSPTGQVCVVGALQIAAWGQATTSAILYIHTVDYPYYLAAFRAVTQYLNAIIALWNDTECSSAEEAIEVLRRVAKQCREDDTTNG